MEGVLKAQGPQRGANRLEGNTLKLQQYLFDLPLFSVGFTYAITEISASTLI